MTHQTVHKLEIARTIVFSDLKTLKDHIDELDDSGTRDCVIEALWDLSHSLKKLSAAITEAIEKEGL